MVPVGMSGEVGGVRKEAWKEGREKEEGGMGRTNIDRGLSRNDLWRQWGQCVHI